MKIEKLRHMSAHVEYWDTAGIKLKCYDGDDYEEKEVTIDYPIALVSYESVVALWDGYDMLYLLPYYNHSNTTWKHLHAFIEDFTWLPFASANNIRKMAKAGDNYGFAQAFKCPYDRDWHIH